MDLPKDLEALRRRYPSPALPQVPSNWKPGLAGLLFGPKKPWGDYAQARALICHGKIPEARELLERLVAVPRDVNWQPEVLLGLETMRPPEGFHAPRSLWDMFPKSEKEAFLALKQFTTVDYPSLQYYLPKIDEASPSSPEGAALFLMAFIGTSDLAIRVQIDIRSGGRVVGNMLVIAPIKALAFLLSRRHAEAWDGFYRGLNNPNEVLEHYKKVVQGTISPAAAKHVNQMITDYCKVGLGLILFDLGMGAVYRDYFKSLAPNLTNSVGQACQMLT